MTIPILRLGSFLACASLALGLSACSSTGDPAPVSCPADTVKEGLPLLGADCDPLVPTQCGFPFPSNVYLQDDPTKPTGKHVVFGPTTLPVQGNGKNMDPALWIDSDGFSPGQPILTHLPGATITGLPTQDTIDASLAADSPTVLIDAETGEHIPHFSEIDMALSDEDDVDRTLMIRPVVRLKDSTRYLVAFRHIVDANGKAITPTPVFQALRDKSTASCDVSVGRRRDLYEDIFSRLEKAGVPRGDLQLAWDYTTASRENNTARLIHMRDDALAKVGDLGPEYTIVSVEENPNPYIRRRILAKMKVPLYLDKPEPGGKLVLDDKGMPTQNGTAEFEVLIHIPNAATKGTPGALLQNGHGLLGYKTEGQDDYLAQIGDTKNYVTFGVDLIGMAHQDFDAVTNSILGDAGLFKDEIDRQHQGLLNSLLAMRMMRGRFVQDPNVQFDGKSAIDPEHRYYRGDSQGGIFGTTYMSISTDVTRGLLGEPGLPYSLLLNRSADFGFYFILLKGTYHTGRNIQLLIGALQMLWDRSEPDGYVPYLAKDPLPNTPVHEVLIADAIGDYQVTPLGAHMIARAVGAKNLKPTNRPIWGVPDADGPFTGSGIQEWSFGLPEAPKTNIPPGVSDENDPHNKIRGMTEAIDQEDVFFRTGKVQSFCKGPCDPQ
ncbi:MAG: hypothetical protein U0359_04365 [Byssovorax sp.]